MKSSVCTNQKDFRFERREKREREEVRKTYTIGGQYEVGGLLLIDVDHL